MDKLHLGVILVVAVVAGGCGTQVSYLPTHAPPHPMAPRKLSSVELLSAGPPQRPYVEIGILEAQQESAYSADPPGDVLVKLQQYAADLGCDALVLTGNNDAIGHLALPGGGTEVTLKGYRGACVVYTGDPSTPPTASPSAAPTSVPGAPPPAAAPTSVPGAPPPAAGP